MNESFIRTEMLLGTTSIERLRRSRVAIFGIGGVGSYVAEALARAGIGHLTLIDHDTIAESNLNRQIHADMETIGILKTEAMQARILRINPQAEVCAISVYATPENLCDLLVDGIDYVVDAIDSITTKLALAVYCHATGISEISSMGMANKLYPERITLADLYETSVCPLARVMRTELRKRGVPRLPVCYSTEPARTPILPAQNPDISDDATAPQRRMLGSVSFVPSAAGLIIAGKVIRDICQIV